MQITNFRFVLSKTLCTIALMALSSGSAALTSVCSGELLPMTGLNTLQHEASWSYHDNWFYNMFVEISSVVDGPVSPSLTDEIEMETGGSALHFLDQPVDGDYTLRGYVQVGYPLPWGFEGYYEIACPGWIGSIENPGVPHSASEETRLVGLYQGIISESEPMHSSCDSSDAGNCSTATSVAVVDAQNRNRTYPLFVNPSEYRSQTDLGTIEAIDDHGIVIRTQVGRLQSMVLPESLKISKVTKVNDSSVLPGDKVGVYWSSSNKLDADAIQVRVYRDQQGGFSAVPVIALSNESPGMEMRGVVSHIERAGADALRLVYAQGTTTLTIPMGASISLIEDLPFPQLQSLIGQPVTVISQRMTDDSLVVRVIEAKN